MAKNDTVVGCEMLDYSADHHCPVYEKVISGDLCYDSMCCLTGMFLISSTKELLEVKDIEKARIKCKNCPYSDLNGGRNAPTGSRQAPTGK